MDDDEKMDLQTRGLMPMDEALKPTPENCKGAFAYGTACGVCSHCQQNLDKICEMTGLVRRSELTTLVAAIEWIMPKVHQGNHEGDFETCPKATCSAARDALKAVKK